MLIDWFTFFAQIFNFLILVWLLKRFLYRPILKAMDQREEKIASRLNEAEQKKKEALSEKMEYEQKNQKFERKVAEKEKDAEREVMTKRQNWLNEAREEIETQKKHWIHSLENEKISAMENILKKVESEVFDIAGKVLNELADEALSERIVRKFCWRLENLNEKEKEAFSTLTSKDTHPIMIKSAFKLSPSSEDLLKNTVAQQFKQKREFILETKPDLISGIELWIDEEKLTWAIADYLSELQKILEKPLVEK